MQPTGPNAGRVAGTNSFNLPQQGAPTQATHAQGPILHLPRQTAVQTPPQVPAPLQPPDTHGMRQGPVTQFRQLFPDAKAIVLSYLPGGEIRIFVDPALWDLVRDSPAVNAFLQAAQQHDQFSAAHAIAEVNLTATSAQVKSAATARLDANTALLRLGQALACATFRMESPEEQAPEDMRKYRAAKAEYDVANRANKTAVQGEATAKRELRVARSGIDSAHAVMRQRLDGIRWVGSEESMRALGIVFDYSDPKAPLDPPPAAADFAAAEPIAHLLPQPMLAIDPQTGQAFHVVIDGDGNVESKRAGGV